MKKQIDKQAKHAFELPDGQHCLGVGLCGFTKRGNSILLAPQQQDAIASITADQKGLESFSLHVQQFIAGEFQAIERRREQWWCDVIRTLGLIENREISERLAYDPTDGITIAPMAVQAPKTEGEA